MLIFYVCDIGLNTKKYELLMITIKNIKPSYVIINGNILTSNEKRSIESINSIKKSIQSISEICPVLLQFAGYDFVSDSTLFESCSNIHNITNTVCHFHDISFCGIASNNNLEYSQWGMNDGSSNIKKEGQSIDITIKQNLADINLSKTFFVTHIPPLGILDCDPLMRLSGSYSIRKLCEGEYTNKKQPFCVLSGFFRDNFEYTHKWFTKLNDCLCIQPSQHNDLLYFALIEYSPFQGITTFYHPYDRIELLKKEINFEKIEQ